MHTRTFRRALGAATVAVVGIGATVAATIAPIGSAATATPGLVAPGTPTLQQWEYQVLRPGLRFTPAQAVEQAQRTDLIVGYPSAYGGDIAAMHQANPNLKVLIYLNGTYAGPALARSLPTAWRQMDAAGTPIKSMGWGNYLMQTWTQGWRATLADQCSQAISQYGFDGCYLDSMGPAAVYPGYDTAVPLDPSTGAPFTRGAWLANATGLISSVAAAMPSGTTLMVNGLTNGQNFYNPAGATSQLLGPASAGLAEVWIRSGGTSIDSYPSLKAWLGDVQMLVDGQSSGKTVAVTVKTWTQASASQLAAWHVFSLATFLLGANGKAFYSFLPTMTSDPTAEDTLAASLHLGAPTSAMTSTGGLYERTFTGGTVAVNPTTAPLAVSLPTAMTNLAGQSVTSEVIAPDSADIFQLS